MDGDGYRLGPGCILTGPAIVEEIDSTTVIHPGYIAQVDRFGDLILTRIEPDLRISERRLVQFIKYQHKNNS